MGDHAYDALYDAIDFEFEFTDSYLAWDNSLAREYPDRKPNRLFDSQCIPSLEESRSELIHMEVLLESNMSLAQYANIHTVNDYVFGEAELPQDLVVVLRSKYGLKFHMMFGMIKILYEGGTLSPKQHKWMDTNWKGGTNKLINSMSDPEMARDIMDWISNIVNKICLE